MSTKKVLYEMWFSSVLDWADSTIDNNYDSPLIVTRKNKLKEIIRDSLKRAFDNYSEYATEPKPEPPKPAKPPECNHKFRDYDWYIEYTNEIKAGGIQCLKYQIYEPYVCIRCHKREDMMLENGTRSLLPSEKFKDVLNDIQTTYPRIRNRAEIEDQINDDIKVDREYLKWADFLAGKIGSPSGKIELRLEAGNNVVEKQDGGEETA